MSMLKKLKSIFIEEVDDPKASTTTESKVSHKAEDKSPPTEEPKANPSPAVNASTSQSQTTSSKGKPDDKFVDLLLKAIEANNVEGFDYLEYKQSLRSLMKIEPDEAKRFQNAYAMAQTMGLDKAKLFGSAKKYIQVLQTEEQKFAQAFEKQKSAQVNQREEKIQNLNKSIVAKEEQIKKLQAEIEAAKKELSTIESKINQAMAKVQSTRDGFYASYNMVLDQIKSDLEKINNYIA